ncbi:hypothetical protein B0O99DRAFT_687532 [Bisporella sp. PMI_857]|nr:hypothetical protein B0O99DRAFT_687532 [Bisporella sp. PMI_857]
MAFPYGRSGQQYSPLGGGDPNVIYQSPAQLQGEFDPFPPNPYDGSLDSTPNLGSPPLEMYGRPNAAHSISGASFASFGNPPLPPRPGPYPLQHMDSQATLFGTPNYGRWSSQTTESQSFLNQPINKIDTSFSSETYHAYKDNTGRQLLALLLGSLARFLVTLGLCAGYILSVKLWVNKGIIDEKHKKLFNAITTGISLALGLNIASSFKDLALNMRWPILSMRRRNLKELDLILNADSLGKLLKLVFITRRPWVIFSCIAWLFINIAAQAGIAMLNLTYGFDVNYDAVLLSSGNISIPDMRHFYPNGDNLDPGIHDEEYMANLYGGLAYYGFNMTKYMPKAGDIYRDSNAMIWYSTEEPSMELLFSNSPSKGNVNTAFSTYTDRRLKTTYVCESHPVIAGGDGTSNDIEVAQIGNITISEVVSNSTNYFTNPGNLCEEGNLRCSIVEAFEASDTAPWYYKCNITMGLTANDPRNLSFISNEMAYTATSSIAQIGYTDMMGQQSQVYPQNSIWGLPINGNAEEMGMHMAYYAMGAIAGASLFNPRITTDGIAPMQGYELNLNHPKYFFLIVGLLCGCQLVFIIIVAVLSNRVKVGPDTYLAMALLLRPIADALEGVSGGKENKAYREAKRSTTVSIGTQRKPGIPDIMERSTEPKGV